MVSSSKKKSSKKKSSQLSSKTKKIKKSHRNASKKIGRRHDSSSEDSISLQAVTVQSSDSNSDNDSTSSLPMSSSSSEGTHRSRKKGSRLKKRDKSRASRRSSSKEDITRGKKRKRSKKKKKGHHESRKKSHKKKPRTRRHASVSPDNNDSSSSSTCKSSSTSEENGIQRHRVKLKENKKRRVESKIETILDKERTDKSPKGSSNSRSSDLSNRDSRVRENFVGENNSRRLKSVITVVVKPDEEEEKAVGNFGGIPHSVDTSDTRSKRDPPPLSSPASDRKRTEDFYGGRSSLITQRLSEPLEYRKTDFAQNNIQYPLPEEHRNESEKDYSGPILPDDSPGGNDLESVLRRKALENLKKFRGKVETDVKTIGNESKTDDDNVDQLSTGKDVVVRRRSPELGSSNVQKNTYEVNKDGVDTNKLSTAKEKFSWRRLPQQVSSKVTDSAMLNESMKPPLKRDDPRSSMSVQQIPDKRTEAVKVNAVDPLDRSVLSKNPIKEHGSSQAFDAKSESDSLLHKEKRSGMQKTEGVSSDKETIVNKVNEAHTKDETNRATSPISTDDDHRRKIKDVSAPNSATGHLSNDQKNEAKEGSDFKEKKMTVMRGGEMVEVSYKVYIPQRAAALARRQLKR